MDTFSEKPEQKARVILVVEDDADIAEFLTDALKTETSCQTLLVTDGFQALEVVKTQIPDLFILDYRLPKMNGLELYEHLQAIEKLKNVPVLLMSASAPIQEIEKSHVYFIEKPFEWEEILQAIERLLAS
jgi:CheY-like chemotaxis protein